MRFELAFSSSLTCLCFTSISSWESTSETDAGTKLLKDLVGWVVSVSTEYPNTLATINEFLDCSDSSLGKILVAWDNPEFIKVIELGSKYLFAAGGFKGDTLLSKANLNKICGNTSMVIVNQDSKIHGAIFD